MSFCVISISYLLWDHESFWSVISYEIFLVRHLCLLFWRFVMFFCVKFSYVWIVFQLGCTPEVILWSSCIWLFVSDLWWSCDLIWKLVSMRFVFLSIGVYLVLRTSDISRLPDKEPNIIIIVLWYETQLWCVSYRRGCLGACLWEWLAVGVRTQSGQYQGNLLKVV